jgi:hypothetical protein
MHLNAGRYIKRLANARIRKYRQTPCISDTWDSRKNFPDSSLISIGGLSLEMLSSTFKKFQILLKTS